MHINGAEVPPVNVIIGGSPCQDLSIAGKRAGLAGERSGLFTEQIRIIKEMREQSERSGTVDIKPRFMVWENVPGAFSSNKGKDFKAVLEETIGVVEEIKPNIPIPVEGWHYSGVIMGNGFSIAWRVFDAQFWGVPQRRRRIALVADFGGATAPEILFERESVSGDFTQSGTPWEEFAAAVAERFGGADKKITGLSSANTVFSFDSLSSNSMKSKNPYSGCREVNITKTLDTTNPDPSKNQGGIAIVYDARGNGDGKNAPTITGDHNNRVTDYTALCVRERCGCEGGGKGVLVQDNKSGTVRANNDQFIIAIDRAAFNQGENALYDPKISEDGINSTLTAKGPSAVCVPQQFVRRLTPLECERLQGFPDNWTNIGDYIDTKGKKRKTSDTSRYKALGNSIALPSWVWVLERLSYCCGADRTMASLFDGIGGFPLIWETLNGENTCLWASEIEEFPIAVTEYHFKED